MTKNMKRILLLLALFAVLTPSMQARTFRIMTFNIRLATSSDGINAWDYRKADVVQYLKSYTHYQVFLDKVSNDIHRGNLEQLIRERQFEELLTLCKYNQGDTPVTKYILRSTEISELMKFITLLSIGRPREYLFSLPPEPARCAGDRR